MSSDPLRETATVWTDVDRAALKLMLGTGCSTEGIARALNRTPQEIERRLRSQERSKRNG